jgi:hypothetical protein
VILDHERRVRESVVDATNSYEGLRGDRATSLDVGEVSVEYECYAFVDEFGRVFVAGRDDGARMELDQALDDASAMLLGLMTSPFDFGTNW